MNPVLLIAAAGAAAYAAIGEQQFPPMAADDTGGPPDFDATTEDTDMTGLSTRTLSWAGELQAATDALNLGEDGTEDDRPVLAFLLRWVQRESDGAPGAVGSLRQLLRDGWAREAGIGQLYFETRGARIYGVTSDELRAGAREGSQEMERELTSEERARHTSSLVAMASDYLGSGRRRLVACGAAPWSRPDLACLAKLKHALPVLTGGPFVSAAVKTGQSRDWDSYHTWLSSLSLADSTELYAHSSGYYQSDGWGRYLRNAQWCGRGQ